MSTQASFRVYRDKPSSFPQTKAEARAAGRSTPTRRPLEVSSAADKENLHPVTGLPPPVLTSTSKKRKTDVLTAKLLIVKEVSSSPKKRRLSVSSSTTVKAPKRGPNMKRGSSSRIVRPRKTVDLPRVDEVVEEETIHTIDQLSREAVDARCYELTVLPLADISEAYETGSDDDSVKHETPGSQRPEVESPGRSSPPGTPLSTHAHASPATFTDNVKLATPERKRIYSAFTFTSPSLAAKRYAASKSSSRHPFSDSFLDSSVAQC